MESLRDVKRVMEREVKKGSCPLMFDRLEFGSKPFQTVTSEEKLDEVLAWLLRLKSFRQYAEKTIINNVYMDLDIFCKNIQFKRTRSVIDREGIYARIQRYKKRLQPDYGRGLCLETARCIFTLPEGEAEKYRLTHDGQETYAFIMSNKYILGLFTYCEAARKSVVSDGVEYGHLTGQDASAKMMAVMEGMEGLFSNPLPSFYPKDLLIGAGCGIALRLVVYFKAKNAKKFRHGMEYGSAR